MERRFTSRQPSDRRDESAWNHGRRFARVERVDDANRSAVKAPIIASHSAVRALCDVSRNVDDEQLLAKKSRRRHPGVAYSSFVKTMKPDSPERTAAAANSRKEFNLPEGNGPGQRARFQSALTQLCRRPSGRVQEKLVEIDTQHPGDPVASDQRLRRPHRLCREADRHRPRRHLLRFRRRRRRHRLERRQRNLQRDSGARPPRLNRRRRSKNSGAATCCG